MDQKGEQPDHSHGLNSSSTGSNTSAPPGQYVYGVNYYGPNIPPGAQYYGFDPHSDQRPAQPPVMVHQGQLGQPPTHRMLQTPIPPAGPPMGAMPEYPPAHGIPAQPPSFQRVQPPVVVDQQFTPRKPAPPAARGVTNQPRKRALTACDTCRVRKIKCDNGRPRCGSCVKTGNLNCHFRTDDQKDSASPDTSSVDILNKLNVLLKDVQEIKRAQGLDEGDAVAENDVKRRKKDEHHYHFDNCVWDMSLTSILRWGYFRKCLNELESNVNKVIGKLVNSYKNPNALPSANESFERKLEIASALEDLLNNYFSNFINSFFINCHTKVPVLDVLDLIESIEIYKILKKYDPKLTFITILDSYTANGNADELPQMYHEALKAANIENTTYRQEAYKSLCKSVPIVIMACALGAIATPIQLDNLSKFPSSTEERKSFDIGSISDAHTPNQIPKNLPQTRIGIANSLVSFANMITSAYPFTTKSSSIREVVFKLLLSQFYLYCLSPLPAYRAISSACQSMMYYLESKKNRDPYSVAHHEIKESKKEIVDRLFWTCLKLECELRVELSPYVPISGITQVIPPSPFPKIADPVTVEMRSDHSEASQLLANKYYDEHSWYYFLTEIAVRKVDNKMFDELHSLESVLQKTWDQESFYDDSIWVSFIKYLNQYNGIINSLSPSIRNFVLQEIDVDQIYKRMKKRKESKVRSPSPTDFDILDNLDDFLVDDDLLLRAQSESIMYIKTRIISSKLLLFRPIIYLILEDRISFMELLGAAMAVMKSNPPQSSVSFGSLDGSGTVIYSSTSHSDSNASDIDGGLDFYNLLHAPYHYQKQHPDEDFTEDIEYQTQDTDYDDTQSIAQNEFKLKNPPLTKSRILRIFVQHLISIPKLLIPKIGAHRHPGLWYYLRNQFVGNVYQFMLYMKIQEMVRGAMLDPNFQHFISLSSEVSSINDIGAMIEMLMPKQGMIAMFEHSLMLFSYWKEESKDCEIYYDYIKKCLSKL
ncbi:uncharacterized protein CANTADRAFT_3804 [Suhomyces tanzawaensis NRRL Y-17324]|uniref:Zn(2)-C6 fungal-type domain-containing protein n=1 Tax=Suhomyces tanzawaensis NRRL Y-17324 TaxID=984487 RepID=A0A1E4SQF1_9ASCO|nr:uncharacterized protein CANTADRAFT_3804 [Suhomyces tanzawaensis NRRL Y-17324]ODV81729.1 hypothetical protein CANTADRAFT_3804 [Suhomyces tanzawaensis NRRL Y-17324]